MNNCQQFQKANCTPETVRMYTLHYKDAKYTYIHTFSGTQYI